jgi:ankyrin repeat protein
MEMGNAHGGGGELVSAAAECNYDRCKELIKKRGRRVVNERNKDGTTPIMAAAFRGQDALVHLVMKYGDDSTTDNICRSI